LPPGWRADHPDLDARQGLSPCAQIIRSGGVANGRGAATQAGQRVGLAQGTACRAGQFKAC
jgi:hypothetical protein